MGHIEPCKETNANSTVLNHDRLYDIYFLVGKFLKKCCNCIHLMDSVAFLYQYTHHKFSGHGFNQSNKSVNVAQTFLWFVTICYPSCLELQNFISSVFFYLKNSTTRWCFSIFQYIIFNKGLIFNIYSVFKISPLKKSFCFLECETFIWTRIVNPDG